MYALEKPNPEDSTMTPGKTTTGPWPDGSFNTMSKVLSAGSFSIKTDKTLAIPEFIPPPKYDGGEDKIRQNFMAYLNKIQKTWNKGGRVKEGALAPIDCFMTGNWEPYEDGKFSAPFLVYAYYDHGRYPEVLAYRVIGHTEPIDKPTAETPFKRHTFLDAEELPEGEAHSETPSEKRPYNTNHVFYREDQSNVRKIEWDTVPASIFERIPHNGQLMESGR